jgi:hypothetical protein
VVARSRASRARASPLERVRLRWARGVTSPSERPSAPVGTSASESLAPCNVRVGHPTPRRSVVRRGEPARVPDQRASRGSPGSCAALRRERRVTGSPCELAAGETVVPPSPSVYRIPPPAMDATPGSPPGRAGGSTRSRLDRTSSPRPVPASPTGHGASVLSPKSACIFRPPPPPGCVAPPRRIALDTRSSSRLASRRMGMESACGLRFQDTRGVGNSAVGWCEPGSPPAARIAVRPSDPCDP